MTSLTQMCQLRKLCTEGLKYVNSYNVLPLMDFTTRKTDTKKKQTNKQKSSFKSPLIGVLGADFQLIENEMHENGTLVKKVDPHGAAPEAGR